MEQVAWHARRNLTIAAVRAASPLEHMAPQWPSSADISPYLVVADGVARHIDTRHLLLKRVTRVPVATMWAAVSTRHFDGTTRWVHALADGNNALGA